MFVLESGIGNYINFRGQKYSYFAGNNYLGLANHPLLKRAAILSIKKYGINFSASRETTGTAKLHFELERLLSEFKSKQDAVVFASGYLGNKILLSSLTDRFSTVLVDKAAHPSIIEGIPAEIEKIFFYDHCNTDHLEILLKKNKIYKPLIMSDGLFALTGEIAPVDKIYQIAKEYEAILVLDDAHATGVLGENGRGTPDFFGLDGAENIFQTETMSKALGAYGGFIAAPSEIIKIIRSESSAFVGSPALPPSIAAAGCAAIKLLMKSHELQQKLFENVRQIREEMINQNFSTPADITPIIPIFFNSQESAKKLSNFLMENYIIAPYIKYPIKMDKFIVRITVSAAHTNVQIERLLELLIRWKEKHRIDENK